MIKDTNYSEMTIGAIVTSDFRAAELFTKAGIDFCCGGNKAFEFACNEKMIDVPLIISQLQELEKTPITQTYNYGEWDLDFLADYIINTHHNYVLKSLPEIVLYTQKIATVHGSHDPELLEVATLFKAIQSELRQHLEKEEKILFPAIKAAIKNNTTLLRTTIQTEIERMSGEHEFAGTAMDTINQITGNYKLPYDACNSYMITYKQLKQFEDDLHIHVHLENNILYPKALKL